MWGLRTSHCRSLSQALLCTTAALWESPRALCAACSMTGANHLACKPGVGMSAPSTWYGFRV